MMDKAACACGKRRANAPGRCSAGLLLRNVGAILGGGVLAAAAGSWQWQEIGSSGGPSQRAYPVVVWTGRELLLWGGLPAGVNQAWLNDGWRYDPASDSWRPMSSANAPSAREFPVGIWTGSALMIWGGHRDKDPLLRSLDTGACYNPQTDTWKTVNQTGAPSARGDHTMVWTGSKAIVWGGFNRGSGAYLGSGACYDPADDSWTAVTGDNRPTARSRHSAVWSGSHMIVWGGGYLTTDIEWWHRTDFGLYDPTGDSWIDGPTAGAPAARSDHSAVWSGSGMIVWGGWNGGSFEGHRLQNGGIFDPVTATWTSLPLAGAPEPRASHCCAWTGREMIAWGGSVAGSAQSGGRFDPATGAWSALPADAAPSGGYRGSAAWSGEAFHVFHYRLARAHETGPYALDGIPDDWQFAYFGPQNTEGAGNQDPDRDKQNNLMEFLAKTRPDDPRSRLTLSLSSLPASGELEFQLFPVWPDRRYRLEQSGFTPPIEWTPAGGTWTDLGGQLGSVRIARPAAPANFYRLAVEFK